MGLSKIVSRKQIAQKEKEKYERPEPVSKAVRSRGIRRGVSESNQNKTWVLDHAGKVRIVDAVDYKEIRH